MRWMKGLICIAVGVLIWLSPPPAGVEAQAWRLLAIFASVIAAFILQPVSIGAAALIGMTAAVFLGVLSPQQALQGFSGGVVWLIAAAFMFSRGFIKSGLGTRLAYLLMRRFGGGALQIAYTLSLTDLLIAPFTPSNTARGGGIIYPITRSLCTAFGSEPDETRRRIGAFLMLSAYSAVIISAAVFLTAASNNVVVVSLTQDLFGETITWTEWLKATIAPGLICTVVFPYLIYRLYPPEIKKTPLAARLAETELARMGAMRREEKILTAVFAVTLLLWATTQFTGFDSAFIALGGLSAMLVLGVLDWDDVLREKGAWDVLIWMGVLVNMASFLAEFGLMKWFAALFGAKLAGISWLTMFVVLMVVYNYVHYGFASNTAHVMALFGAFASVAVAAGAPVLLTAILLGVVANTCSMVTHYACGVSPIFFGSGYITQGEWWRIGFVLATVHLVIWLGIGVPWMKWVGVW